MDMQSKTKSTSQRRGPPDLNARQAAAVMSGNQSSSAARNAEPKAVMGASRARAHEGVDHAPAKLNIASSRSTSSHQQYAVSDMEMRDIHMTDECSGNHQIGGQRLEQGSFAGSRVNSAVSGTSMTGLVGHCATVVLQNKRQHSLHPNIWINVREAVDGSEPCFFLPPEGCNYQGVAVTGPQWCQLLGLSRREQRDWENLITVTDNEGRIAPGTRLSQVLRHAPAASANSYAVNAGSARSDTVVAQGDQDMHDQQTSRMTTQQSYASRSVPHSRATTDIGSVAGDGQEYHQEPSAGSKVSNAQPLSSSSNKASSVSRPAGAYRRSVRLSKADSGLTLNGSLEATSTRSLPSVVSKGAGSRAATHSSGISGTAAGSGNNRSAKRRRGSDASDAQSGTPARQVAANVIYIDLTEESTYPLSQGYEHAGYVSDCVSSTGPSIVVLDNDDRQSSSKKRRRC